MTEEKKQSGRWFGYAILGAFSTATVGCVLDQPLVGLTVGCTLLTLLCITMALSCSIADDLCKLGQSQWVPDHLPDEPESHGRPGPTKFDV